MAYNLPSQYQPAWEKLKKDGVVRLVADPRYHERIWNALRKRKNRDLGFKLLNSERYRKAVMSRVSDGNKLIVTLEYFPNLTHVGAF